MLSFWLIDGPLLRVVSCGHSSVHFSGRGERETERETERERKRKENGRGGKERERESIQVFVIRTLILSDQGTIVKTSFNLKYFLTNPISEYSHTDC